MNGANMNSSTTDDIKNSKRNRWDKDVRNDAEERDEKRVKLEKNHAENETDEASNLSNDVSSKVQNQTQKNVNVKLPSLSLDALAKAKKALQMQKELSEKLKKLPQFKSSSSSSSPTISTMKAKDSTTTSSVQTSASVPTTANLPGSTPLIPPNLFPGVMPGVMPGSVPTSLQFLANLDPILQAQQVAARLGLQATSALLPPAPPTDHQTAGSVQTRSLKTPVLRLDAMGREVDEEGKVIGRERSGPVSTLKVNINKKKKEAFQILHPENEPEPLDREFYDPAIGTNKTKLVRQRRMGFSFVEEGKFVKEAEGQRIRNQFGESKMKEMKERREARQRAAVAAAGREGREGREGEGEDEEMNPNLIEVAERVPVVKIKPKAPIPDVEWWDAVLLIGGKYSETSPMPIKPTRITAYIEHPILLDPPAEIPPPSPQPLPLTSRERKKLRTQKRLAREKERQEMVRQGILQPPKPKVKMSNLMKVLVNEAVQDPTRMEKEVRKQAQERERAHADRNLARKLTPGEKREKKERKLFEGAGLNVSGGEVFVSVYRVEDMSNPQVRFKVDVNAQQNKLTGCVILTGSVNLVIVEGGSKSIKRYGKLMMRRINWNASLDKDEEMEEEREGEGDGEGKCVCIWNGCISVPNFDRFVIQRFGSSNAAKKFLSDHHCGHFWDLAESYVPET